MEKRWKFHTLFEQTVRIGSYGFCPLTLKTIQILKVFEIYRFYRFRNYWSRGCLSITFFAFPAAALLADTRIFNCTKNYMWRFFGFWLWIACKTNSDLISYSFRTHREFCTNSIVLLIISYVRIDSTTLHYVNRTFFPTRLACATRLRTMIREKRKIRVRIIRRTFGKSGRSLQGEEAD